MRKFLIPALASAALLATASAASACYWVNGFCTCLWGYNAFGVYGCWY
jgi:hypothetical protein